METSLESEHHLELEVITPSALESLERASVDIQISTARRYPRQLTIAKNKMLSLATLDEETAASCFYRLNRAGKSIEGPSIRLAEVAASCFGNLRFGARVVNNDGRKITAQGFCHDLENNVLATIEVSRRITDKTGRTYSEDMQTVTGNAACSIAARNAIFKVVPFALVKPIYEAAKHAAVGDIKTLAERRTKMLAKFATLGVPEKRIFESLGKSGIDEIGLTELEYLIGIFQAVKDGEQSIDEAFPVARKVAEGVEFEKKEETKPDPKKGGRKAKEPKPETNEPAASPAPAVATPLEGLRNLINASPIKEEEFRNYLIADDLIEPNDKLETLSEVKVKWLIDNFLQLAEKILNAPGISE